MPALLAAAPSPLVVGSVRDQFGAPIAGARISAGRSAVRTDAQGTFALAGANISSVTVTCAYCRPLTLAVTPDQPVIALVQRYDALSQEAPSERDIASVPYGRAESVAALRPFAVLENSSHPLPGAQISDRGTSSRGALLLDNGIPVYDVASNQSPFVAFPAYSVQRISWLPPTDAFTYGDLAGGGTVIADTHGGEPWSAMLAGGSSGALSAGQTLPDGAWLAATSRDAIDTRARADALLRIPSGENAFTFNVVASQDRLSPAAQHLNTSVGGLRFAWESAGENQVSASVAADGGGYDGAAQNIDYSAKWSDVQMQAGVTTNARVQFFSDASVRASSGYYRTSTAALPLTAGTIAQTHVDFGAQTAGDRYSLRAGAGAFDLRYAGGAGGARSTLDGGIVLPSFFGSYAFDPHWTLQVQAGESFALPTILEAFVYPPDSFALAFDRNMLLTGTLGYGDLRRFRASLTTMSERVTGLDSGTIHSSGISVAWQIAPALSLRAWLMHENDQTQPYEPIYRFGVRPQPATVGSYWLTYETTGLRIDAIYRRDLLDYQVDPHFDASISAPLSSGVRLFGSTERRAGTRLVTVGLRTQIP